MSKVDILRLDSVTTNDTKATTTINTNFQNIQSVIETLLSRTGVTPNYMDAVLDMNSYRIINTAMPTEDFDVVNLKYLRDYVGNLETLVSQTTEAAQAALDQAQNAAGSSNIAASAAQTALEARDTTINTYLQVQEIKTDVEGIANQSAGSVDKAKIWAEGTDAQVQGLGGEHSAKGWAQQESSNYSVTATGTTTSRTLKDRFADVINVKDFGAKGDGVTDDTQAFQNAIRTAIGKDCITPSWFVDFPECVTIYVPAGDYLLNSTVDCYGKDVVYVMNNGAEFLPNTPNPWTGLSRLNGRVVRDGLHFSAFHFGIKDKGSTLSILGNPSAYYDVGGLVDTFSNVNQLANVSQRDSCALCVDEQNPEPTADINSATYDNGAIYPNTALSPETVKKLKVGMIIDTKHSPKYAGFITGWKEDGSAIYVSGWYKVGDSSSGQVPDNNYGAFINKITVVFSQNNRVWLEEGKNAASSATGFELDVQNDRASCGYNDTDKKYNTDGLFGFDCANFGKYEPTVAFIARGGFENGFHCLPTNSRFNEDATYLRTGTTVVVTSNNHRLLTGNIIKINSASDTNLQGHQQITVLSEDTFSFTTNSTGTTSGEVNYSQKNYATKGFLYGGDGYGFVFNNYTTGKGIPFQVRDAVLGDCLYIYYNGGIYTKGNITQTNSSDVIHSIISQNSNSIYRVQTPTKIYSIVGWANGDFSIYDQTRNIQKLYIYGNGDDILTTGNITSSFDATYSLGTSSKRWSEVFAATSTINTSDERQKQNISDIDERIFRAWGKVEFKQFVFKDAFEQKGENARIHFGVIAQRVKKAFESEGLDGFKYGLLCYDEWEDEYENIEVTDKEAEYDEDGNEIVPAKTHTEKKLIQKAGNAYGIRYAEALALECAYQRWKLEQMQKQLNKLLNNNYSKSEVI